jgi:hypothetical protein
MKNEKLVNEGYYKEESSLMIAINMILGKYEWFRKYVGGDWTLLTSTYTTKRGRSQYWVNHTPLNIQKRMNLVIKTESYEVK